MQNHGPRNPLVQVVDCVNYPLIHNKAHNGCVARVPSSDLAPPLRCPHVGSARFCHFTPPRDPKLQVTVWVIDSGDVQFTGSC